MVRAFAVDTLRRASDEELLTYLLQLVQALRYEGGRIATGTGASLEREASLGSVVVEDGVEGSSPLSHFLIERACGSKELANFLSWYLKVNLDDATCG